MPRARRRTTRKRTAKKPWWKPNPMSRAWSRRQFLDAQRDTIAPVHTK